MIDTNKLRRLAQAAMHPVTKGRWMRLFGERTVYDRMEDGCRGIPVVSTPVSPPHPFEAACLDFIAAANPAAVIEILDRLDRLEAAESECLEQARLNGMGGEREAALMAKLEAAEKSDAESIAMYRKARDERDALRAALQHEADCVEAAKAEIKALRAKVAEMEQQEPVAKVRIHKAGGNAGLAWSVAPLNDFDSLPLMRDGDRLYAFPGAQAQNVPKAVAYLDLGTGGYMDIGTDLTDEALAALPKGRHMLGIVGTYGVDGYVPAQNAPSVPEGWKLVPIVSTDEMDNAGSEHCDGYLSTAQVVWDAMLAAAPEFKP